MRRMPSRHRIPPFARTGCPVRAAWGIRPGFPGLSPCGGQVPYVLLTRAPVAGRCRQACTPAAPRLACVKPVASVHPEPGSNSSLLLSCFLSFQKKRCLRRAPEGGAETAAKKCPVPGPAVTFVKYCVGLTECSCARHRRASLLFLVLLRLGYCKTINVLALPCRREPFRETPSEKLCKVTANFPNRQIFSQLFFRTAEPGPGPGRYLPEGRCAASAAAPASFPKAGAKVRTSHIPSKFLCDFF